MGDTITIPSEATAVRYTNMPYEGLSGTLPLLHPSRRIAYPLTELLDTQFWTSIYSSEITSNECTSGVQSLLNCPSKITVARSFRGADAQKFIDFLDRVSKLCVQRLDN